MNSILFVCTGNTCRSPMAEALFRKMLPEGTPIRVASAGIHAHPGTQANPTALKVLKDRKISFSSFRSQATTATLLEQASYIFVMTKDHRKSLQHLFPAAKGKIFLVTEFIVGMFVIHDSLNILAGAFHRTTAPLLDGKFSKKYEAEGENIVGTNK